jgi:hypothetical protein
MRWKFVPSIIFILAGLSSARIINIPADYPTIQAGIDAAINGDTVLVAPGEYVEDSLILQDKNVFLTSAEGPGNTHFVGYVVISGYEVDTTCVLRGFRITMRNIDPYRNGRSLVQVWWGSPRVEGNIIENNETSAFGAGIGTDARGVVIRGNIIRNNWTWNIGGGIFSGSYDTTAIGMNIIERNIISGNQAGWTACESGSGGGIVIGAPSVTRFNIIINNEAFRYICQPDAGGLMKWTILPNTYYSNTIVANSARMGNSDGLGGGIRLFIWGIESGNFAKNNIIAFNTYGAGVYATVVDSADFEWDYNLVFGNGGGDYIGIEPGPHDIQADPLFVDRFSGDYHLLPNSPCIDAGDPTMPLDPDGTRADIGAYYFDQSVGIDDDGAPSGPYQFSLRENYPNPFNGETIISYYLDKESTVSLFIFSITGHLVLPLLNKEFQEAGEHKYLWEGRDVNGRAVSTGIYFYELYVNDPATSAADKPATTTVGKHRESKAMILIK